jgi:hypothetical protein
MVRIRLTKKLATSLNGVDLSSFNVGDIVELPDAAARMIIAERWAELANDQTPVPPPRQPATAS